VLVFVVWTLSLASIACLKRALYLDPFEWIISYNLGGALHVESS
jgi:hypothetical protein